MCQAGQLNVFGASRFACVSGQAQKTHSHKGVAENGSRRRVALMADVNPARLEITLYF
jgi:hypothetical protein